MEVTASLFLSQSKKRGDLLCCPCTLKPYLLLDFVLGFLYSWPDQPPALGSFELLASEIGTFASVLIPAVFLYCCSWLAF